MKNDEIKSEEELKKATCENDEPTWKGWVRPISFLATLIIFFILLFTDGNFGKFHVRDAYLPILETVLVTIVVAFFGSRGVEKTTREITKAKRPPINEEPPDFYKQYKKK